MLKNFKKTLTLATMYERIRKNTTFFQPSDDLNLATKGGMKIVRSKIINDLVLDRNNRVSALFGTCCIYTQIIKVVLFGGEKIMRKLILALALVAFVAAPAAASVQNVKISGSVDSWYIWRDNFDLGESNGGDDEQQLFVTISKLHVDADLTDQVAVTVGLINERAWEADGGATSADATDIDLYLAYVTLREMLYSPLTLVVGRQVFSYGNSFIFDATGANNAAPADSGLSSVANDLTNQTSLDAIRAILDYNPLTVDLVFAVVEPGVAKANAVKDDVYLYGINANYELGDELNSVIEAYFWKKVDKSDKAVGAGEKADVIKVTGIRGSTNPIEGLNVQAEFAYQGGSKRVAAQNNKRRRAYGVQGIVNYQLPVMEEYNPMAQYVFTKVTGEAEGATTADDWTGWDPFFEAQGGGKIYNSIFNLSNAIINAVSLSATPMEDVMAKVTFTHLMTERDLKGGALVLVQPDGDTPSLSIKNGTQSLGKELDLELYYDYTEDVQIGVNAGWFFPGAAFTADSLSNINNNVAKQVLVNLNVAF
ncbi:MAG: alginate export family protein [Candidatus Omnitrophica bacterium]|nr:alginate export family protein [Candidatus Omnitrophota bacterium]